MGYLLRRVSITRYLGSESLTSSIATCHTRVTFGRYSIAAAIQAAINPLASRTIYNGAPKPARPAFPNKAHYTALDHLRDRSALSASPEAFCPALQKAIDLLQYLLAYCIGVSYLSLSRSRSRIGLAVGGSCGKYSRGTLVLGVATVACTAGPNAAESGVAGTEV